MAINQTQQEENVMNKQRRAKLQNAIDLLEQAKAIVEEAYWEECEYADNMPENLRESSRYLEAEEASTNLDEAKDEIEETVTKIQEAMGHTP